MILHQCFSAIESFQYDLDALSNACDEQESELRMLQSLMQNQCDRSTALSVQEDAVFHELNALEIDAHTFTEELHLVSNTTASVEAEIDAMSRVRLMSIPFDVRVNDDWDEGGGATTPAGGRARRPGRYPTINNLRLAYRARDGAGGPRRDEISAAFSSAAQLAAHALGLYPGIALASTVRVMPIHPCAKILVSLPEGQSVHSLGFDATAPSSNGAAGQSKHVPCRSIALFVVVLSQLSAHILAEESGRGRAQVEEPPFPMTEVSIDGVDVTKLAESNHAAWSSVVFCIAANLRWLSGFV